MPTYELGEPAEGSDEERQFTPIPEDTFADLEVLTVKEKVKPWRDDDGNEIKRVEFGFIIHGGEFDGRKIWGETSTSFVAHPGCRLYSWVQGIMAVELPAGFKFNTDTLVGSRCRGLTAQRSYTKKGETEPRIRNYIKDVFPAKDAMANAARVDEEPF